MVPDMSSVRVAGLAGDLPVTTSLTSPSPTSPQAPSPSPLRQLAPLTPPLYLSCRYSSFARYPLRGRVSFVATAQRQAALTVLQQLPTSAFPSIAYCYEVERFRGLEPEQLLRRRRYPTFPSHLDCSAALCSIRGRS